MTGTADTDDVIEVSADGLTVRKAYAADEFPVPAIRFEIRSDHDDEVTFRLSEAIPESFPMDKVGFHPDYHSDAWTAYQDNHVEFTGTVDPDEEFVTVYGIRIDDESDAVNFLDEPDIVEVSADGKGGSDADEIDDTVIESIVDDDRNQPVKDMISGKSDTVPGLEDDSVETDDADEVDHADDSDEAVGDETTATSESADHETIGGREDLDLDLGDVDTEPEPVGEAEDEDDAPDIDLGFDDDEIPGPEDDPAATGDADDEEPTIDLGVGDATHAEDGDESESSDGEESEPSDSDDDDPATESPSDVTVEVDESPSDADAESPDSEPARDSGGPIAPRLADELESGDVDEDALETLRDVFDVGPSTSEISRIDHLQSRVETVAAYTDALEEFLDEHGTGQQLIAEFEDELESFESDLTAMDERLTDTEDLVLDIDEDLAAVTDRTDTIEADVAGVSGDVDDLEEDVDELGIGLDELDDEVEDIESGVDAIDQNVDDLEADVTDLADDLEDVREDVTDIQDWRDQLGSMFSD